MVLPDSPDISELPSSSMKNRTVWFCALANVGNVFAVTFLILYLTFGQYGTAELCFYTSSTLVVGAVSAIVVLRKSQLNKNRLDGFMEPVRKGVIAHRGGARDGPENTLLAFREAKKNGASSVEMDLEMTKDGVAVLLHDASVDRTTDGTGYIKDMKFEEIRKLNAAARFGEMSDGSFEQIPTVEEAIQLCNDLEMNIFFDVKNYSAEMLDFLIGLYQKYPHLYNTGMVCSFYPQVIYQLRHRDDQILTALTTQPDVLTDEYQKAHNEVSALGYFLLSMLDFCCVWSIYNWLWFFIGNSAVLLKHTTVSKDVVRYWQERDVAVVTWTVNTDEGKHHFREDLNIPVISDEIKCCK